MTRTGTSSPPCPNALPCACRARAWCISSRSFARESRRRPPFALLLVRVQCARRVADDLTGHRIPRVVCVHER
nr:MAG: hypothetical protein [Molluscum contagiosum virus]